MLHISHPTEYGTLYTKSELKDLSSVCRAYGILLYMESTRPFPYNDQAARSAAGKREAASSWTHLPISFL